MVADYPSKIPSGDFSEKNFGQAAGTGKENGPVALLKNALIFLVLIGVVAASFLVSFQLGKKILVPTKKVGQITAAVPETPASIKSLQKLQAIMSAETAAKVQKPGKLSPKKAQCPPAGRARARRAASGHYYKVQAGLFRRKANAAALADKLKAAGIDVFIRRTGGRWRVQAGAYKTNNLAAAMQSTLSKLGYQSKVIYE
jgi:cell division protein FtsN